MRWNLWLRMCACTARLSFCNPWSPSLCTSTHSSNIREYRWLRSRLLVYRGWHRRGSWVSRSRLVARRWVPSPSRWSSTWSRKIRASTRVALDFRLAWTHADVGTIFWLLSLWFTLNRRADCSCCRLLACILGFIWFRSSMGDTWRDDYVVRIVAWWNVVFLLRLIAFYFSLVRLIFALF